MNICGTDPQSIVCTGENNLIVSGIFNYCPLTGGNDTCHNCCGIMFAETGSAGIVAVNIAEGNTLCIFAKSELTQVIDLIGENKF